MLHAVAERVHAHGATLGAVGRRFGRAGAPPGSHAPDGARTRWVQWAVIDGMRMLFARAARAALARSQSGSLVRRTNELCASHSAVHDVHVSRYEPPE